jgi:hypothetical protein
MRNNALIDDKIFTYFLMKEGTFFSNMTLHPFLTYEENFLNLHPLLAYEDNFFHFLISVWRKEEKCCFTTQSFNGKGKSGTEIIVFFL